MNSKRIVRSSKFRHVFTPPTPPPAWYAPARIPGSAWLGSDFLSAGLSHFALPWGTAGGGAIAVLAYEPNEDATAGRAFPSVSSASFVTGADARGGRRLAEKTDEFPIISGHRSPVLDVSFHPAADTLLASAGQDCVVKIWSVGRGSLSQYQTAEQAVFVGSGHGQKVGSVEWNPVAAEIVASSASDGSVHVYQVTASAGGAGAGASAGGDGVAKTPPVCRMATGYRGDVTSLCWDECGSRLAVAAKDKTFRVGDPREGTFSTVFAGHPSVKGSRLLFLDPTTCLSTGYNTSSGREVAVWDLRATDKPLYRNQLDVASGMLSPHYDADLGIVYLTARGEGTIRLFEYEAGAAKPLHRLTEHKGTVPYKGGGFLPKRALDVSANEVGRYLALCDLKNAVIPISFHVPRKSRTFQEDIFPATASGNVHFPLLAPEWLAGANAEPAKVTMADLFVEAAPEAAEEEQEGPPQLEGTALSVAFDDAMNRIRYLEVEIHLRDMLLRDGGHADWVDEHRGWRDDDATATSSAAGSANSSAPSSAAGATTRTGPSQAEVDAAAAKSVEADKEVAAAREAEAEAERERDAAAEAAAAAAAAAKEAAATAAAARRRAAERRAAREAAERVAVGASRRAANLAAAAAAAAAAAGATADGASNGTDATPNASSAAAPAQTSVATPALVLPQAGAEEKEEDEAAIAAAFAAEPETPRRAGARTSAVLVPVTQETATMVTVDEDEHSTTAAADEVADDAVTGEVEATASSSRDCAQCDKTLDRSAFSKNQLSKRASRCRECVEAFPNTPRSSRTE